MKAGSILFLAALACVALEAQVAQADCSDRSYDCILSANVRYDSTSKTYTTVDASCKGDAAKKSATCTAGVKGGSSNSLQFTQSGTSAGSITLGRCFQFPIGCLPNQCKGQEAAEDRCNRKHPLCAGSCTAICTDACNQF